MQLAALSAALLLHSVFSFNSKVAVRESNYIKVPSFDQTLFLIGCHGNSSVKQGAH